MGWRRLQEGKRRRHHGDSVPMSRRWPEGRGRGGVKAAGGGSLQTGGGRRRRCGPAWLAGSIKKAESLLGRCGMGRGKDAGCIVDWVESDFGLPRENENVFEIF
jgi:hypothetical protein